METYYSRGGTVKVSKSTQHKDMYNIEETGTRMAHNLHSSDDLITIIYPKDAPVEKKRVVIKHSKV